jgi:hypothetical protein
LLIKVAAGFSLRLIYHVTLFADLAMSFATASATCIAAQAKACGYHDYLRHPIGDFLKERDAETTKDPKGGALTSL